MNLRLNREADLIWICLGAIVFTLLLPWIIGAGAFSSPELEARKHEIEQMSADDRRQLEANFEEYKKSQQYLRDEYRKLHEAVDADSELLALLNDYCELVEALTPNQRAELKKPRKPQERAQLVASYLQESGPRFGPGFPPRPGQPPPGADGMHRYVHMIIEYVEVDKKFSLQETEAVVSLLEESLDPNSSAAKTEPIWKRGYMVLDRFDRRSVRNARSNEDGGPRVFDKRLQERLIAAVKNPTLSASLKSFKSTQLQWAIYIRELLLRSLLASLVDELIKDVPPEFARQNPPPPNERGNGMPNGRPHHTPEQQRKHAALMYRLTEGRQGHELELTALDKLFRKDLAARNPSRGDLRGANNPDRPDGRPGDRPEPRAGQRRPGFPPPNSDDDNRPPRPFGKGPRERPPAPKQP